VLHVGEGGAARDLGKVVEFVQEFAHRVIVLCNGDKIVKKREK
jgi:adenine deaminase